MKPTLDYTKTRRKFVNEQFGKTKRNYTSMEQLSQLDLRTRGLRARLTNPSPKQKAISEAGRNWEMGGQAYNARSRQEALQQMKKDRGQFVSKNWRKFL